MALLNRNFGSTLVSSAKKATEPSFNAMDYISIGTGFSSTVTCRASNSQLTSLVLAEPSPMKTSCTNCAPANKSAATDQQMGWKTAMLQRKGQSRGVGSLLRGSTALQSVSFSLAPHLHSTPARIEGEILNLTNQGPCSSHFILHSLCQYRLPSPPGNIAD